jgi:dipeptidyl aminopeptidase/acylaminoacyl peptidase
MSPEQAKGKPVDRRADIWAFGCILFEMLAGRRPFLGDGVSEVIAAVIMAPVEFKDLPPQVPARIRRLVRRCMEKDPRRRLRDIGDARLLIEETLSGVPDEATGAAVAAAPVRRSWTAYAAVTFGAAAVAALVMGVAFRILAPGAPEPPVRRFEVQARGPFRSGIQARLIEISPDGRNLAHVEGGKLFIRPLARVEEIAIPTTAEPVMIFWSPDSAFIGYAAGGKLWKAPAGGGESTAITDIRAQLTGGSSASWCPDGKIVLGTGDGGILRVSAGGGDFSELIPLEKDKEGDIHGASCLPDGSVLFVPHAAGGRPNVLMLFLDGHRKELFKIGADQDIWFPVYSATGHILFHRHPANAGIWALPFSLTRHEVTGEPFLVAPDADVPSVSADGTLVHVKGSSSRLTQLVWVDRTGKVLGPIGPPQEQWPFPALSPDGRHVAISAKENDVDDVWIHDADRATHTRLSTGSVNVTYSVEAWSPDARSIVYVEGSGAPLNIKTKPADGSGEAKLIHTGWGASWSADGRYLLFADLDKTTAWDCFYIDTQGDGKPIPLAHAPATEQWPRLSPDGKYFAYISDEGGGDEVYLKRFPGAEGKWQVSVGGGYWPRWSPKGDRIYYVHEDTIMEVEVTLGPEPRLGTPRALFTRKPLGWPLIFGWPAGFDVTASGDRFVIVQSLAAKQDLGGIVVLENWWREFSHPAR